MPDPAQIVLLVDIDSGTQLLRAHSAMNTNIKAHTPSRTEIGSFCAGLYSTSDS